MLSTIRQFAGEHLAASGEEETTRQRHATYFAALAAGTEARLRGPEQRQALDSLEQEHDNTGAALEFLLAAATAGDRDALAQGAQMAAALWRFWYVRGYLDEGRWRLDTFLTAIRVASDDGTVVPRHHGKMLLGIATIAHHQRDYAIAGQCYTQSLAIARACGDLPGAAESLTGLGLVAAGRGDLQQAAALHQEGLAIWRQVDDQTGTAQALGRIALLAYQQGDLTGARLLNEHCLTLRRAQGDRRGIAFALGQLGFLALEAGDAGQAARLHAESLELGQELGATHQLMNALEGLAGAAAAQGASVRALRLAGAAAALRERVNNPPTGIMRERLERWLAPARRSLRPAGAVRAL